MRKLNHSTESQFAHSRVVHARTGNRAWVSWAQDEALDTTHTAYKDSDSYPATGVLKTTLSLWNLHCLSYVHTHTHRTWLTYDCLFFQRKWSSRKVSSSSVFGDYLDNRAPGLPEPDRGEWKDALNFFLLFPLHLTDIHRKGKCCPHWTQGQKTKHKVTPEQLSQNIQKIATAWRRSMSVWHPSCSFANKEYMNYHL